MYHFIIAKCIILNSVIKELPVKFGHVKLWCLPLMSHAMRKTYFYKDEKYLLGPT